MDGALGSLSWGLIYWLPTLSEAEELEPGVTCCPFQPRPFCDSMTCWCGRPGDSETALTGAWISKKSQEGD